MLDHPPPHIPDTDFFPELEEAPELQEPHLITKFRKNTDWPTVRLLIHTHIYAC